MIICQTKSLHIISTQETHKKKIRSFHLFMYIFIAAIETKALKYEIVENELYFWKALIRL